MVDEEKLESMRECRDAIVAPYQELMRVGLAKIDRLRKQIILEQRRHDNLMREMLIIKKRYDREIRELGGKP